MLDASGNRQAWEALFSANATPPLSTKPVPTKADGTAYHSRSEPFAENKRAQNFSAEIDVHMMIDARARFDMKIRFGLEADLFATQAYQR